MDRPTEPTIRALRTIDGGVDLDLFISPEIACLEGHFPAAPIVPGVAQVDWAVKLAARHLNIPIAGAQAFRVKFRRIILPNTVVTLSLRLSRPGRRLDFQYSLGVEKLSLGSIIVDGG